MKIFNVLIEETLCRVVTVQAESEEQADEIVQKAYDNEEIILTADDYNGELVLGGEYTDEVTKDEAAGEIEYTPEYLN